MRTITTERLQGMQMEANKFLLVNTLEPQHFDDTKIPGAINIPLSNPSFIDDVLQASGSKQKLVVVYCASQEGNSSREAAQKLQDAGFVVANYKGGAAAWRNAGQPIAG